MRRQGRCPRCGATWDKDATTATPPTYPALSRRDNATDICSDCGVLEALEDARLIPPYEGPTYWRAP